MEKEDNLVYALKILIQHKNLIVGFSFAIGVTVAVSSLLLPNYYQANTTFLAASPDQAIPDLALGMGKREAQIYGGQGDINRILTVGQSGELEDYLIAHFNLMEHYEIDPNHKKAPYKVKEELRDHLKITKTDKDAIQITVEDKDPEWAAQIANSTREKIDEISQDILKASQKNLLANYNRKILEKENLLKTLTDSLFLLRGEYQIFNGSAQTESLTTRLIDANADLSNYQASFQYLANRSDIPRDTLTFIEAKIKGLTAETQNLTKRLSKMNEGLSAVKTLEDNFNNIAISLNYEKESRNRLFTFIEAQTPALILIEAAQIPLVKSRPKRSLLVIGAILVAFLLSTLGVLFIESTKQYHFGRR
jgi:capsular polysaccharide biosynthesis protein